MKALKYSVAVLSILGGYQGVAHSEDDMSQLLPNAKAGECYAQVVIPAKYRTDSSNVVIRAASEKLNIIPAKYDWVDEKVLVSEASVKYKVVPATFKSEKEEIELSPAKSIWVTGSEYSSVEANPDVLSIAAAAGVSMANAQAGQCFVELYEEPEYKQVSEKILISEASESIKVVPAKYEWVEQKEMVASATQKMVEVPAVFQTVKERIKVEDARVEWRKGRGAIEKIDNGTGDVMCLVEIPAVYKTVEKTVMKSPPRSRLIAEPVKYETVRVRKLVDKARETRVEIPARYRDVSRKVKISDGRHFWVKDGLALSNNGRKTGNKICKKEIPAETMIINRSIVATPASVTPLEVPARYQTKKVRRLVSKAQESRTVIPAVTREVTTRVKVSDSRMEWRSVLCETNMTSATIKKLQRALNKEGYEVGEVNGVLSESTLSSVRKFQGANGMGTGGLTIEVLRKLGIDPG